MQEVITGESENYSTFAEYKYNQNSQLSDISLGDSLLNNIYNYMSERSGDPPEEEISSFEGDNFKYFLTYALNGNITNQYIVGSYRYNFSNTRDISMNYNYDMSNRLVLTQSDQNSETYSFTGINTYDHDGNLLTLSRSSN